MVIYANIVLLIFLIAFAFWVSKRKSNNLNSLLITVIGTFCGLIWSIQTGLFLEKVKNQNHLVSSLEEIIRLSPRSSFVLTYLNESWVVKDELEYLTKALNDSKIMNKRATKILNYMSLNSATLMHFEGSDTWFLENFVLPLTKDDASRKLKSLESAHKKVIDKIVNNQLEKLIEWRKMLSDLEDLPEFTISSSNSFRRGLYKNKLAIDKIISEFSETQPLKFKLLPHLQLSIARNIGEVEHLIMLEILRLEWKIGERQYLRCRIQMYNLEEYKENCFYPIEHRIPSQFDE